MATGDILSVAINSNGWSATIKIEGLSTGGTYDFGYGADFLPEDANIEFSLTSQGYSASGVLGTTQRTVYGTLDINTGARRLAYPNEADPDETISGSDVEIVIPLSDYIFSYDTLVSVDIATGWYTQGGNPSNAAYSLSVTNNSTETYPVPIGNWATPGHELVRDDFILEFTAFHRYGIACVKFEVTDGTNTENYTVTELTKSAKDDYNTVLAYVQSVDVSRLDDGVLTAKAVIYPNVGNASSLLNTDDAVNTWPTPLYTNQAYRLDVSSNHGFTVVDPTNGNDTTGTVYSSQAAAEAGAAYQTMAAAQTGLQSYHNTNAGHNDAGGGTILLLDGTTTVSSTAGGTLTEWLVVTKAATATKSTTIFGATANNASHANYMKVDGVTFGNGLFFSGGSSRLLWAENCTLALTGTLYYYNTPYSAVTRCDGVVSRGFVAFSTSVAHFGLVRGNNFDDSVESQGYTVLGNRNISLEERGNTTNVIQNNVVYAFNNTDHSEDERQIYLAQNDNVQNIAIVQNIQVRYGTQVEPIMMISADGTTTTTRNVILWHNSFVGARCNLGYNDITTGGPYSQVLWSIINNIFSNYNNKDDVFGSNQDATGGWPVGYSVGASGNMLRTSASDRWFGEFQGLSNDKGTFTVPLEPGYVDDESADGGNTSGGDYHISPGSPAYNLAIADLLPFDIEGSIRTGGGASGAYENVSSINCDTFVLGAATLSEPGISGNISPDDITLSGLAFSSPEITGNITPADLILSPMVLSSPVVTGETEISCDTLILGALVLSSPGVSEQGDIICDNLLLSGIVLPSITIGAQGAITPDIITINGAIQTTLTISGELS